MQHLSWSDDTLLLMFSCNESSDSSGIVAVQILRERQAAAALRIQVSLMFPEHIWLRETKHLWCVDQWSVSYRNKVGILISIIALHSQNPCRSLTKASSLLHFLLCAAPGSNAAISDTCCANEKHGRQEACIIAESVKIWSLFLTFQAVWRGYLARHGGKGKGKGKGKMAKKPSKKKK